MGNQFLKARTPCLQLGSRIAVEVAVARHRASGIAAKRLEDLYDANRQVAVDVRVHAGERELQSHEPPIVAHPEERPSRGWHPLAIATRRRPFGNGLEVQARKGDIERGHERRVGERRVGHRPSDALRHPKIQTIEPLEAVRVGSVLSIAFIRERTSPTARAGQDCRMSSSMG